MTRTFEVTCISSIEETKDSWDEKLNKLGTSIARHPTCRLSYSLLSTVNNQEMTRERVAHFFSLIKIQSMERALESRKINFTFYDLSK